MVSLEIEQNEVSVFWDCALIGKIELYTNTYHIQNQYLKIDSSLFDSAISKELFWKLCNKLGKPLQVMVNSDRTDIIDFIVAGGFHLKRKCYEIEATAKNYAGTIRRTELSYARAGEKDYNDCCKLMYERYKETHKTVNPLTADYNTFICNFPKLVFYEKTEERIIHLAFMEENEIAYVFSKNETNFITFAETVISKVFAEYSSLYFEADDCDGTAMVLKSLFYADKGISCDTYIYDKRTGEAGIWSNIS